MTDMDDEAMKAMARRIAADMPGVNALQRCAFLDGQWDDAPSVRAALAAIIETREDCARVAETLPIGGNGTLSSWVNANESPMGATRRHIAAAIRSGQQFRKDV